MVFDKVAEILAEQLDADKEDITADTRIAEDLNADSLDVVELLMTIEDKYGITVPDDEVQNLRTIALMSEYIENNAD